MLNPIRFEGGFHLMPIILVIAPADIKHAVQKPIYEIVGYRFFHIAGPLEGD